MFAEVHRLDGYPILLAHASVEWLLGGDVDRAWIAEFEGSSVAHVSVVRSFSAPGLQDAIAPGSMTTLGLTRLFITSAGRGLDAASALVSQPERCAAAVGPPLALEVAEHNLDAIALYERRGWRRINSYTSSWFGEDGPHPIAHVYLAPSEALSQRRDNTMDSNRAALEEHWRASESGDAEVEHAIYALDAILDYPQSGERFRGRSTIAAQRGGHPAERHFTVLRITGSGNLWVNECIITYDGVPTYSVSVMEFADEKVAHETQYFADPFGSPEWRAALAEPMPGRHIEKA